MSASFIKTTHTIKHNPKIYQKNKTFWLARFALRLLEIGGPNREIWFACAANLNNASDQRNEWTYVRGAGAHLIVTWLCLYVEQPERPQQQQNQSEVTRSATSTVFILSHLNDCRQNSLGITWQTHSQWIEHRAPCLSVGVGGSDSAFVCLAAQSISMRLART